MRDTVLILGLAILATGLVVLIVFGDGPSIAGLAPEGFGRLVALSALVVLIGSGLIGFRGRLSPRLWHVAVWLALFVALIAAYNFLGA